MGTFDLELTRVVEARKLAQIIADLQRRVTALERANQAFEDDGVAATLVPFSLAGAITESTSPPFEAFRTMQLHKVRALLGTAGGGSTVVHVYVNGVSVATLTLAAGARKATVTVDVDIIGNADEITVGVTTAGAGAEDLDVICWLV